MKKCSSCGKSKLLIDFSKDRQKSDGLCSSCKSCVSVKQSISRKYKLGGRENVNSLERARYKRNAEVLKIKKKAAAKKRYHTKKIDPLFKLEMSVRCRMYQALKGLSNSSTLHEIIGCSLSELKPHIEKKFKAGWSWKDWGSVFELDHIKPCSKFDLSKQEEFKKCFHFSNLQPLEKFLNRSKYNRMDFVYD